MKIKIIMLKILLIILVHYSAIASDNSRQTSPFLPTDKPIISIVSGIANRSSLNEHLEHERKAPIEFAETILFKKGVLSLELAEKTSDLQEKEKLFKQAIDCFQKEAKQGHAPSQNKLGNMYEEGKGVKPSFKKAKKCYKKAAMQNYKNSQHNLGRLYISGKGGTLSIEKAIEYYKKAALQGHIPAQEYLYSIYIRGEIVSANHEEAFIWLEKAINHGSKKALKLLPSLYLTFHPNIPLSCRYIEELQKLAKEDEELANELFLMADKGLLGSSSEEVFKKYYQEFLESGINIISLIGLKSLNTKFFYNEEIVKKLQEAAEMGNTNAQILLGAMHREGQGVQQCNKTAAHYFKQAASKGNIGAQFHLGDMYERGEGVHQSDKDAAQLYLQVEQHAFNQIQALLTLGGGEPITSLVNLDLQSDENAYVSFRRKAQFRLGVMFDTGIGLPQSYRNATEYYYRSAHYGDPDAALLLGTKYLDGLGTLKNRNKAVYWLKKASEKGTLTNKYSDLLFILYGNYDLRGENFNKRISFIVAGDADKRYLEDIKDEIYNRPLKQVGLEYKGKVQAGDNTAQFTLALLYRYGLGVPQDLGLAQEWEIESLKCTLSYLAEEFLYLRDKPTQRYQQSKIILDFQYAREEINRSYNMTCAKILEWFTAASKEVSGRKEIMALYRLGRMHEYGWGTVKDNDLALAYYALAAEQKYSPAYKALGEYYWHDACRGEKLALRDAVHWYRCAAKQDDIGATAALKAIVDEFMDGQALYALGRAYEEGWGIAREEDEALAYYTTSANQGYPKAQYIVSVYRLKDKIKDTEFDPILQLVFLSGKEATDSYFKLIGKKPNYKQKKHIKRLMDFDYGSYYDKGYYKAQHKLAELYETGMIIPLINAKNPIGTYEESMRLYEAAIKSEKPVPLVPLERVKRSLTLFKQKTEHQRLREQDPEFDKFIKKSSGSNNLSSKFLYQLYTLYIRSNELSGEVGKELQNIIIRLASLSENNKQAQGMLSMVSTLVSSAQFDQQKNQITQLKKVRKNFDMITRPWYFLHLPSSIPTNLRILTAMIQDPRIEIFNAYFKPSEEDYDSVLFNCAVNKILDIFDRLTNQGKITNEALQSEADREAGDVIEEGSRNSLKKLLTANNSSRPNNRFAHRLIHISDMVYEQFRKDPALTATQLIQWAKRGVNCLTAGEYEMDTFYTEYVINVGMNSNALSRQEHTLEMQVAISLAKLRGKVLEELVDTKEQESIHTLNHLKRRSRVHLGLLGDTENYIDVSGESTINSQYLAMSFDEILICFIKKYTPELVAQHIAKEIDNQNIDYNLIIRRLKLQYIQAHFKSKGIEDELFEKEDYLLERWTKAEIYDHIAKAISKNKGNPDEQENYEDILEWDKFNKQAEEYAIVQMRKNFYDENYHFTPLAAKALLYSLKYIEEEN